MYKFFRFYNQYRKEILITLVVVIFIFLIVQVLNAISEQGMEKKLEQVNKNMTDDGSTTIQKQATAGGESISTQDAIKNEKLIYQFVKYCNEKKAEEAYALLSEECKSALFPTVEEFTKKYVTTIFKSQRQYNLTLWISDDVVNIYKIEYLADLLATGGKKEDSIVDYISIVETKDTKKININKLVIAEKANNMATKDNIKITNTYRQSYIDYQIYTFVLKNDSENTVVWYDQSENSSFYVEDVKQMTYGGIVSKYTKPELTIAPGKEKEIEVKVLKNYSNKAVKKMVFENIVVQTNPTQTITMEVIL